MIIHDNQWAVIFFLEVEGCHFLYLLAGKLRPHSYIEVFNQCEIRNTIDSSIKTVKYTFMFSYFMLLFAVSELSSG